MNDVKAAATSPRTGRRTVRKRGKQIKQLPWGQPLNPHKRLELLSADAIEAIHMNSLRILEEIGVAFHLPAAVDLFAEVGAVIGDDGINVRFGRDIVEQALSTVARASRLTPRNAGHAVDIDTEKLAFATVLGPPNCHDVERGRRPGTIADFADFVRLGQFFNIIHMIAGSPVEPMDVPVEIRHLVSTKVMLELSDKVPYVFCHSPQRIHDVLDMIAISRGIERDDLIESPSTYAIINTNSPLQYDAPMAAGLIELARYNQTPLITPFSLAGATMPVSLAGAVSLSNAEMLAGLVLTQLANPGAPVVTGAKTLNVDMKTGAPAFGSAEANQSLQIGAQLARRYGLPYRASNFTSSNAVDAQAAYESQAQLWAGVLAGANVIMHAAGWLEGGLCSSFDKFILDVEILQMMASYLQPVEVSDETLAFDEVVSVGRGGHYFGTDHTIASFESAFYLPLISNTKNYGQWAEEGSLDATQRAHALCKRALDEYQKPALEPDRQEALDAFVARRTEEGGAPIDW